MARAKILGKEITEEELRRWEKEGIVRKVREGEYEFIEDCWRVEEREVIREYTFYEGDHIGMVVWDNIRGDGI